MLEVMAACPVSHQYLIVTSEYRMTMIFRTTAVVNDEDMPIGGVTYFLVFNVLN